MKKFKEYIKLREVSALSLGKNIIGGGSSIGLDAKSEEALQAVIEALEILLDKKPAVVTSWLKVVSSSIPEIQKILSGHDFDRISDLKGALSRAGKKLGKNIRRGLGDESGPIDSDDVLSPNAADSFKGESYLIETGAVCARCGKEGRASKFDINAGKARCRDCGGFMNRAEPKPRKKKEVVKENYKPPMRGLKVADRRTALGAWKIAMGKLGKSPKTLFNGGNSEREMSKWEEELASTGHRLPDHKVGDELADWLYGRRDDSMNIL